MSRSLAAEKHYREKNREKLRIANRDRMKGKPRRTSAESRRAWTEKNKEKIRAHMKVYNEIRYGRWIRPDTCEECGRKPGVGCAGQSLMHAHHDDYSKPLEVRWLCVDCHRQMDRLEVSHALGH